MHKVWSRLVIGCIALSVGIVMSGCTVPSKTAAMLVDGNLVFVSCEPFAFTEISVVARDYNNWDGGGTVRWSALGGGTTQPGEALVYGSTPKGFQNLREPLPLPLEHHRIEVYLEYTPANEPADRVAGLFDSRELRDDAWLRGGGYFESPCE